MRLWRSQREHQLVMDSAHRIGNELIFIDHQQPRTFAAKKARALRLERCDDDLCVQIERKIARRNPYIPTPAPPFRRRQR